MVSNDFTRSPGGQKVLWTVGNGRICRVFIFDFYGKKFSMEYKIGWADDRGGNGRNEREDAGEAERAGKRYCKVETNDGGTNEEDGRYDEEDAVGLVSSCSCADDGIFVLYGICVDGSGIEGFGVFREWEIEYHDWFSNSVFDVLKTLTV